MRTKKATGIVSSLDAQIKELTRRRKVLAKLEAKRAKIQAKLDRIDSAISELTGGVAVKASKTALAGKAPRAPRGSLTTAIIEALNKAGKALTVGELTAKVKEAGVISGAADPQKNVSNILYASKRFKKAGRGKFVVASK